MLSLFFCRLCCRFFAVFFVVIVAVVVGVVGVVVVAVVIIDPGGVIHDANRSEIVAVVVTDSTRGVGSVTRNLTHIE